MGKVSCPLCSKVFDSAIEYQIHKSHAHSGIGSVSLRVVNSVNTVNSVHNPTDPEISQEDSYSLAISRDSLGELYPVLKDAHGNIIDGYHRKGENPEWHEEVRPQIDTPEKLALAQLAVNACRRGVPASEKRQRVEFLSEKCGLTAKQIHEGSGLSLTTIYKYMPQKLKSPEKVEAGRLTPHKVSATLAEHPVKTSDVVSMPTLAHVTNLPSTEPKPFAPDLDEKSEEVPEGCPICPVCEASMNISEFQEVKRKVKTKFGSQIQTLLFA